MGKLFNLDVMSWDFFFFTTWGVLSIELFTDLKKSMYNMPMSSKVSTMEIFSFSEIIKISMSIVGFIYFILKTLEYWREMEHKKDMRKLDLKMRKEEIEAIEIENDKNNKEL